MYKIIQAAPRDTEKGIRIITKLAIRVYIRTKGINTLALSIERTSAINVSCFYRASAAAPPSHTYNAIKARVYLYSVIYTEHAGYHTHTRGGIIFFSRSTK